MKKIDENMIEKTLNEYPNLPFKLLKYTDTSYKTTVYYHLAIETDLDKTNVDINDVVHNCETKEEMDKEAVRLENSFANIIKVVEIEC